MSTFGPHSVACQAHALICAVQNLRDEDNQTALDFRVLVQTHELLAMADSYMDFENDPSMAFDVCSCAVKHMEKVRQLIVNGEPARAQQYANACLEDHSISPSDYVFLVRWTEGR